MQQRGPTFGRPDNTVNPKFYYRDNENTMSYSFLEPPNVKFFPYAAKAMNIDNMLNYEDK